MKKDFYYIFVVLLLLVGGTNLYAQESIFSVFKSDLKKANDFFKAEAYYDAVQLYARLADQKNECRCWWPVHLSAQGPLSRNIYTIYPWRQYRSIQLRVFYWQPDRTATSSSPATEGAA